MYGGIVTVTLHSLMQSGFGFREFVLLVINPAHTVEVSAVVGLLFQGALDEVGGFVEALTQVAEHVTVIVEDRTALGINGQGFLELVLGAVEEFLALVDGAE